MDMVQYFARTDVGCRRVNNEDSLLLDEDLGLVIVADGMGGHHGGETASRFAVETVHQELLRHRDMIDKLAAESARSEVSVNRLLGLLEYSVQKASTRVFEYAQAESDGRRMGTTLSLVLVVGSTACIAHAGDSRVFLIREDSVYQVTEDHTVGQEMVKLGMSPEAVQKMPTRHSLTRAVGTYPHVEVDTMSFELLPGDELLVTSDGLHGYFESKQELLPFMFKEDGEQAIEALVEYAKKQGGRDNISVALVKVGLVEVDELSVSQRLAVKRDLVGVLPLFANLQERELLRVFQLIAMEPYRPGEVVAQQGEPMDRMYTVLAGRIRLVRDGRPVGELGAGEHFGEGSLTKELFHGSTMQALELTELITLKREDFFEILRYEPKIGIKLLWELLGLVSSRLDQTAAALQATQQSFMVAGVGEGAPRTTGKPCDPFTATSEHPSSRKSIYTLDD